jgi:hypothetical protein
MKKLACATVLLILSFWSMAFANRQIKTDEIEGMIFESPKQSEWSEVISGFIGQAPDGYWDPSEKQVLLAESKLKGFLERAPELNTLQDIMVGTGYSRKVWEYLDSYSRQYLGYNLGAGKFIYINCVARYCRGGEWETKPAAPQLMGGGIYRLQLAYDMNKGEFARLEVSDGGPE